ncbi:hypothetical protein K438DRAFT_1768307 [Mycena galopus ATCC 62051]|nr:hypothetical protein K438DRAFT_1768307 [Mycena galopus ATCC 62051]
MYYDSQAQYDDPELYYDDPEPYVDDLEPYYDDPEPYADPEPHYDGLESSYADVAYEDPEPYADNLEPYCDDPEPYADPEPHHNDLELSHADTTYEDGPGDDGVVEFYDGDPEDEAAWDVDRYAPTQPLDYGGEEEEVYPLGDEVELPGAAWHTDDDLDPHAVDYGESTAWGHAWIDGPSPGECPEVWEVSMAQWRDHILATHDVTAGKVQGSETDNGVPALEADSVWMAPELVQLQAALQRGDVPMAEQEQLEHTLAELWADELEHQRAVAAGYTWDEERGDYWHPIHGYTADEEEEEPSTCPDEYEVIEGLPPPILCEVIVPVVAQVRPASTDTPPPMWQRILSISTSLPRRPRSPHRHRTAVPRLSKSRPHKRAESAPTKRKARCIASRRASSYPDPQRDRPPHLPALDPSVPFNISHPPSQSLPCPKVIVVPRQPGPPDIPSRQTSAVLSVDPEFSATPSDPIPTSSTLLLAPSAQRRRNALRRLAKKRKG